MTTGEGYGVPQVQTSSSPTSGSGSGSGGGSGSGSNSTAMGDLLSGQVASSDALADEAYQNALANISTQRSQMLQQYGYNENGTLDNNDPYGLYQQGERSFSRGQQDLTDTMSRESRDYGTVLGNQRLGQANEMGAAHADALARGLHGGGVAGKAQAAAMQAGALQRAQLGTQHSDSLADFSKQQGDLNYQHGLGQYQIGMDMTNSLSGLDQQQQQALFQKNGAYNDALMQEVMARLQNPDQYAGG
jgi:hypothetical protein